MHTRLTVTKLKAFLDTIDANELEAARQATIGSGGVEAGRIFRKIYDAKRFVIANDTSDEAFETLIGDSHAK